MILSAIVAVAKNNVIGRDNDIPWYLPNDLKYFKRTTLHRHVIMGRKSYESIGRPLPKRTNIIITRNPYYIATGCLTVHSLEEAIELAKSHHEEEAFIIGGGEIYKISLPYVDKIYLTTVDVEPEGSVLFPELDPEEWILISEEAHKADEKNEHDYSFKVFERKKN